MPILRSGEVNRLADHNFDAALEEVEDALLVLDFTADWCEPCKAMEPSIEELAEEFGKEAYFAAIDLDHSPELTDRFSVMSIPVLLMLHKGEPVKRLQGARPKDALRQEIGSTLKSV